MCMQVQVLQAIKCPEFRLIPNLQCGHTKICNVNKIILYSWSGSGDRHYLATIHWHQWKEHVNVSKCAKFQSDILEIGKDRDPQSPKI